MMQTKATDSPDSPPKKSSPLPLIAGTTVGNFVEWFDFALYGFAATIIAATFFPPDGGAGALAATFAVYAAAFVIRPVGGYVLGRIGDRYGRRRALSISVIIMGLATAAIGLIPSFSAIGWWAPALLLVFRCLQGFSAAGEFVGATTFLMEHAPQGRRGLWCSFVTTSTWLGTVGATALILVLQASFGPVYQEWVWRVPFVFGGLIAMVGLYVRLRLAETPVFIKTEEKIDDAPRLRDLWAKHKGIIMIVFVYNVFLGILTSSVVGYLPSYLISELRFAPLQATITVTGMLIVAAITSPMIGALADKYGRRRLLIPSVAIAAIAVVPAYGLLGVAALAWLGMIVMVVATNFVGVVGSISVPELLPPQFRFVGLALPTAIAYAIFSGTAPLVNSSLISAFGTALAPGFYTLAIGAIAFLVLARWLPETRDSSIAHGAQLRTR
ncbi:MULTISPECIES: MFS transporter [Brevibacterium]|uniref:MFS transporter n=1 Tax=Brevibacterium TaxID=1696 RepID=UPI0031E1024E